MMSTKLCLLARTIHCSAHVTLLSSPLVRFSHHSAYHTQSAGICVSASSPLSVAMARHQHGRMSSNGNNSEANDRPTKVLVLGGSYGGLSVALNLVKLFHELPEGDGRQHGPESDIRIVDERDGFCELFR